jgi:hypothetical protein
VCYFSTYLEEQLHFWGAFAAGVKAMNAAAKKKEHQNSV